MTSETRICLNLLFLEQIELVRGVIGIFQSIYISIATPHCLQNGYSFACISLNYAYALVYIIDAKPEWKLRFEADMRSLD